MDVGIRLLSAILMIGLPIGLGVFLVRRFRVGWRLFLIGGVTFLVSQVFHLPFNSQVLAPFMESMGLSVSDTGTNLVLIALLVGLSAGVFEEVARYLVLRFWIRDARSWQEGLMFGSGHGGMEAILLGGLAMYTFLQAMAFRGVDLTEVVPPENLELARTQMELYWGAPWHVVILQVLERVFAMSLHLSAAVLVLRSITDRNPVWFILAVAWHTLFDAVAVYGLGTWGIYITEGLIGLMALGGLGIIWYLRPGGDQDEVAVVKMPSKKPRQLSKMEPKKDAEAAHERLEDSRFD